MDISTDVVIDCKNPDDTWADVLRCLQTLYGSRVGTLALDRDFGIDWSFIDAPQIQAKAQIEAELINKTRKYEKRVSIERVTWDGDFQGGQMVPKVVLNLV